MVDSNEANKSIAKTTDKADGLGGKLVEGIKTAAQWGAGIALAAGSAALAVGGLALNVSGDLSKALNGLQAATGVSAESIGGMRDAMLDIYNNNFGQSFEDIGKSMTTIQQQTGLSGTALGDLTKNALMLRDTFEFEVNESVRAANMLMQQFGMDGEAAYNLIAQGAQWGLDKNGDLLDTVNEYSVHFKQMGFDSEEMFNMLANGAAEGTFSVDKLGDAVKEFGIRSKDGSKTSSEAFAALGLDAKTMTANFAEGGEKANKAFELVTTKLLEMKDPVAQNTAGVGLFGTQWEDLGVKGIEALTNVNGEIGNHVKALENINSVKYDSFNEAMAGIGRQIETGLLLPLGEKLTPILNDFANWIQNNMPAIIESFKEVGDKVVNFKDRSVELLDKLTPLIGGIVAGTTAFGLYTFWVNASMLATVAWTTVTGIATGVGTAFTAVLAFVGSTVGIVVIAIGLLVAAGILLYKNWDVVKEKAIEIFNIVSTWIKNKIEDIKKIFTEFTGKVKQFGVDIVTGLWNGISSVSQWIKDKVTGFVTGIGKTIKEFFGIASPSKLTTQYGINVGEGFANGISSTAGKVGDATQQILDAAKAAFEHSKKWIDDRKYYNQLSLTDELAAWERVQKRYASGTKERAEADREVYRVKKQLSEAVTAIEDKRNKDSYNATKAYEDAKIKVVEESESKKIAIESKYNSEYLALINKANSEIQKLNDTYIKALDSREKSLYNYMGVFDEVKQNEDVNGQVLLKNLNDQVMAFDDWQKNIHTLVARGMDEGVVNELKELGPKSGDEIRALTQLSDNELQTYTALWQAKHVQARQEAIAELEGLRKETDVKINQINDETQTNLETLKAAYDEAHNEINKNVKDKLIDLASDYAITMIRINENADSELKKLSITYDTNMRNINYNTTNTLDSMSQGSIATTGNMMTGIIKEVETGKEGLSTQFSDLYSIITTLMGYLSEESISISNQMMTGIIDAIRKSLGGIYGEFFIISETVLGVMGKLTGNMKSIGIDMMNGLIAGIQSREAQVVTICNNIAKMVAETMRRSLQIKSPSKVMEEVGGYTIDGLVKGMSDKRQLVSDTVYGIMKVPNAISPNNGKPFRETVTNTNTTNDVKNITVNITNNITDKKTADYATENIIKIFQGRGLKGAFL